MMEGEEIGEEVEEEEKKEEQKRRKKTLPGQMLVNFVDVVDVALAVALFEAVFVIPGWRFLVRKFRVSDM